MSHFKIPVLFLASLALAGEAALSRGIEQANSGNLEAAAQVVDSCLATETGQKDHRAHFIKGLLLARQGRFKEAAVWIERSTAMGGSQPGYYRLLGLLEEKLGETQKALAAWRKCLEFAADLDQRKEAEIHVQFLGAR